MVEQCWGWQERVGFKGGGVAHRGWTIERGSSGCGRAVGGACIGSGIKGGAWKGDGKGYSRVVGLRVWGAARRGHVVGWR